MLHTQPDAYHNNSSGQSHHNPSRVPQVPRSYSSHNAGVSYRGTSTTPVQPYAFQTTPNLRQDSRTGLVPASRQSMGPTSLSANRTSYAPSSSASTSSTNSASNSSTAGAHYTVSKDDSVLIGQRINRPSSTFLTSSSTPDLSLVSLEASHKPSPDRYRRLQRRTDSSNSVTSQHTPDSQRSSVGFQGPIQQNTSNNIPSRGSAVVQPNRAGSADDSQVARQQGGGRYRRRSVGAIEPSSVAGPVASPVTTAAPTWSQVVARGLPGHVTPVVSAMPLPSRPYHHRRTDSTESKSSSKSAKRPSSVSSGC
jgi:hypothetical protein